MLYLLQRGLPKCFKARYLGKFWGQSLQGIYFRRVNDCTELYTLKHTGSSKWQNSQDRSLRKDSNEVKGLWPFIFYYKSHNVKNSEGRWKPLLFNLTLSTCHFSFCFSNLCLGVLYHWLCINSLHLALYEKYFSIVVFCLSGINIS